MRSRKLRIAWSAMFGIVCAMLIALWLEGNQHIAPYALPGGHCFLSSHGKLFIDNQWIIDERHGRIASSLRRPARIDLAGGAIVPIWILVSATLALAAIPWLQWRFSLRTLLIAMTLVAAILGA